MSVRVSDALEHLQDVLPRFPRSRAADECEQATYPAIDVFELVEHVGFQNLQLIADFAVRRGRGSGVCRTSGLDDCHSRYRTGGDAHSCRLVDRAHIATTSVCRLFTTHSARLTDFGPIDLRPGIAFQRPLPRPAERAAAKQVDGTDRAGRSGASATGRAEFAITCTVSLRSGPDREGDPC
jgi:hypothetical protein